MDGSDKLRAFEKDRGSIVAELDKVLLETEQPSRFFYAIADSKIAAQYFPEIFAMRGVPQEKRFHPEGDVFIHSMLVLDEAAKLRERSEYPLEFMYSALLHDIGKCVATQIDENGRITAYGHEVLGDQLLIQALGRLKDDPAFLAHVRTQVNLHMRPNMLYGVNSKKKKTRLMFDLSPCPNDLILLSRADASGKLDAPYDPGAEAWLRERLEDYRSRAAAPMLAEEDLTAAGIDERLDRTALLARARRLHFAGVDRKKALKQILNEMNLFEK